MVRLEVKEQLGIKLSEPRQTTVSTVQGFPSSQINGLATHKPEVSSHTCWIVNNIKQNDSDYMYLGIASVGSAVSKSEDTLASWAAHIISTLQRKLIHMEQ